MKIHTGTILVTIFIIIVHFQFLAAMPVGHYQDSDVAYVWIDPHGEGRNQHVFFRRSVTLEGQPEKAELNVFADSRYILFINGAAIHFGPARSFPPNPVYDTYDLRPYLRSGNNVIAVKVRSNGTNTFQLPLSRGGFIAWGEIHTDDISVDLATPGEWKARRSEAYLEDAPRMSFATGPMEIHDAAKDPVDWNKTEFDDSSWSESVLLENQEYRGKLRPRNIPFLTQDKMTAKQLLWKRSLKQDEKIYSFRIKTADQTQEEFNSQKRVFAYTYIWSPETQNVETGAWWGEYFLNGVGPLERVDTPKDTINRQTMKLDLKSGWNFFFIKYDVVWASWEFHLAVNKNHGLIFSPDKDKNPTVFFRTAGPFTDDEEDRVNALPLPFESPDDLPGLSAGWVDKGPGDRAGNPAWNIAWSYFDRDLPSEPYQVFDITIEENQPTALTFDMGGKKLGRIFIEYEAPAGTRFDIGFSEDLVNDRPWVLKRPGLFAAVSHTSAENTTRFETFKPYGLRYIHLNVTGHSEDVKIKSIGVINQIYPFELHGSFSSSDPMFDAIWKLGWRTLLVCSEDTYTDTPFRERGLYAGDALPQYAITLAGSGDSGLMKRSLEVFQYIFIHLFKPGKQPFEGVQGLIDDYPLIALECFRWVVQYTGDMAFARKYYESYRNMIEEYRKFETYEGLTIFPNVFIEWTELPKRNTASTAGNALMVRSYRNMAWLARQLDMPEDAATFDTYAETLTSYILTHCWDEEKGAFHDGYINGQKIDHHYPIQSAMAVAFGITNERHHQRLKQFFAETLADVKDIKRSGLFTPYGGYYILGALYKLGQAATAEKFIRQFWSPMIIRHNDTAWENFSDHADGIGQGTLSHAWSGGPTFYMSTQVLGVPLMFPDFETGDELVIAPQSATLSHAKGSVPRPEGLIHVEWRLVGDNLFVTVEAPEDLKWKVQPAGRLGEKILFVNGRQSN